MEIFKVFGSMFLQGSDEVKKDLDDVDKKGSKTGDGFKTLGSKITSFAKAAGSKISSFAKTAGQAMAKVTGVVSSLAVGVGTVAVKSALELEASQAKFQTVFGEYEKNINGVFNEISKLTPMTKAEFNSMSSGIQDLLVPMGLARDKATELTGDTMRLVGALTNFNSATHSAEDVSSAFQSALTGSTDSLKALGIQVTQEQIALKAVEMGLADTTKEVDNGAKAQALMALAYEQSGDALNAYNAESLDTKTKIELLKSQFTDMAAELGVGLLPSIMNIVDMAFPLLKEVMDSLLPIFENIVQNVLPPLISVIEKILPPIVAIVTVITEQFLVVLDVLMVVINNVIEVIENLGTSNSEVSTTILKVWETVRKTFENIFKGIQTGIENFIKKSEQFWEEYGEDIEKLFNTVLEIIVDIWEYIEEFFKDIFDSIQVIVDAFIKKSKELWEKYGEDIKKIVVLYLGIVKTVFKTILDTIKNIFKLFSQVFTGDWDGAWETIKTIFSDIWEAVKQIFSDILEAVGIIVSDALENMRQTVTDGMETVKKAFSDILDNIKKLFTDKVDDAKKWGSNMISGFVDGIKEKASAAVEAVSDVMKDIKDFIGFNSPSKKGEGRNIVKWGANMARGFADGIEDGIKYVISPVEKLMSEVATKISKGSEEVYKNISDTLSKSFSNLTSQYDKLGDGIITALEKKYNEQEKIQVNALNQELANQRKLTDSKLKEYDRDYLAKIKTLDAEEARAINAIYKQINAIDDKTNAENEAIAEKEYNEKLVEKYNQLALADLEDKASIQAEIDEMISNKQRQELLKRREDEKESLRLKIEEIQNNYAKERAEEEKIHNAKVKRLNKDFEAFEQANEKEMLTTEQHYENLRQQENLEAEARKLILEENNDEMINLLQSYNPEWLNAGKSFGEKMLEGLLGIVPDIETTINGIMQSVSKATEYVSSSLNSVSSSISSSNYTIQAGDTLSKIARKFGTTISELANLNNISNTNLIRTGDELQIPMLATGGNIVKSGQAIVGEAGAELIDLPRGATVTPLTDEQKNSVVGGDNYNITVYAQDGKDTVEKLDDFIKKRKKYKELKTT